MPHDRKYNYGGWNLPHGISYSLAPVKVYIDGIDGTSAMVAEACHKVAFITTVAEACHTVRVTTTVAVTCHTV